MAVHRIRNFTAFEVNATVPSLAELPAVTTRSVTLLIPNHLVRQMFVER